MEAYSIQKYRYNKKIYKRLLKCDLLVFPTYGYAIKRGFSVLNKHHMGPFFQLMCDVVHNNTPLDIIFPEDFDFTRYIHTNIRFSVKYIINTDFSVSAKINNHYYAKDNGWWVNPIFRRRRDITVYVRSTDFLPSYIHGVQKTWGSLDECKKAIVYRIPNARIYHRGKQIH